MTMPAAAEMTIPEIRELADSIRTNVEKVMVGKTDLIERLLTALISGGHVLLEDVPGTGKTVMARSLARSVHADFRRIQFTPDLLPSDLTGIHYYNQKAGDFVFRAGPIFTQILLADEINRATPRTQSSLLECMEEHQVSIDGETHQLKEPFFVIATQNPVETQGTYPLPEAQLDRFFIQLQMGYPDRAEGYRILQRFMTADPLSQLSAVCDSEMILAARKGAAKVFIHDSLLDYALAIAELTRNSESISLGVSPRGTLALVRGVRVLAAMRGRHYAVPEDFQDLLLPVFAHRLILRGGTHGRLQNARTVLQALIDRVPVPIETFQPGR